MERSNIFAAQQRCIYCDIIRQELAAKIRIVGRTGEGSDDIVTLEPYAPRFAFETWLLPQSHASAFEDASPQMYANLSKALKELMVRINKVLISSPSYNLVLHTSPVDEPTNRYYHWHLELMPRIARLAGSSE